MKAVLVKEKDQSLYIGEAPYPTPSANELLVRAKATALNRADLLQKRGYYPPPSGASPILGLEMAGIVEEVGSEVRSWSVGDRVFALLPGGGYAEFVSIPSDTAMRIPEGFSYEEAAAVPEAFLTAYLCLFKLGGLRPKQTVLVHAGASGVGTAAIQLVREAGAVCIVTAGSHRKREVCLSLGAALAIDYKAGPFESKIKEVTAGKGINLILDCVGAPFWEQNINSLAMDGRLVIIAAMGGTKVENLDLRKILSLRLQIIGSTLRARTIDEKIELTKQFSEFALRRFADGRLVPVIDKVWSWREANEAHDYMEQNRNIGKIVLRID